MFVKPEVLLIYFNQFAAERHNVTAKIPNVAASKNQQVMFDVILARRKVLSVTRFPTTFGSVVSEYTLI